MISKRQYASIVLIMLAVFLLFQGTQLGREHLERQQANIAAGEAVLRADTVWTPPETPEEARARKCAGDWETRGTVVLLGAEDTPEARAAAQWARYARRTLSCAETPEDPLCAEAELLLVPGEMLAEHTPALRALMEKGVNLLCLTLPPAETVAQDAALRELLGITGVRSLSMPLAGLRLFAGFLLGGERIYVPRDEEEAADRQDLPAALPWYTVRGGTETYLRGVLTDADAAAVSAQGLKNEDLPAVIWRRHWGKAELFAVNGPFMADPDIAGGVLQAALSKLEEVSLYPVLDAQLFTLVDFPALSDENSDVLLALYGRKMTDITRNIILPSLVTLPNRQRIVLTAFAAPQFCYTDAQGPQEAMVDLVRQAVRELRGELGLSLQRRDVPTAQKLAEDAALLRAADPPVTVTAVWADAGEAETVAAMEGLSEVRTVVTDAVEGALPLDYCGADVTLQRVTCDAVRHSFMDDLRLLGRETSLGYDNAKCDFASVWFPETEDDHWQNRSETVFSNLTTYRRPFAAFARVTATECDGKLRRYLALDYAYRRDGEELTLTVTPSDTPCSFVLRLNGETVAEVTGGTCTPIEDGAFLLRADGGELRVSIVTAEPLASLKGEGGSA